MDSFEIDRIARIPLQTGGTVHAWATPDLEPTDAGRLTRYCSAANSELVFANSVIFVEGEGDFAVIEKLLGRACQSPGGHYALGITVVEASGLGKIKYLVQLAEMFGVRSYVLADRDGLHNKSGQRVLITVLDERTTPMNGTTKAMLHTESDKPSASLKQAISRQKTLNELLENHDAFILSSDLEGMFLDSFGVTGLVDVLGPTGEGLIDEVFAKILIQAPDGYEKLAAWLGSKGWNSDRKTSGKMAPHLAPFLIDSWFEDRADPAAAMRPLTQWLGQIVKRASQTPV